MDLQEPKKCEWFNKTELNISKLLPYFKITRHDYGKKYFNSINHLKSKTKKNKIFSINKNYNNVDMYKNKLIENKENILNKNLLKKESSIKSIITKQNNIINNSNKIMKTQIYEIYPNNEQQKIIFSWMHECVKVYNECINSYNNNDFNLNYMKSKLIIFDKLYGKSKKDAPYDMLTGEVQTCCSNIKSCLSNLKNKNITHFKMTHKNTYNGQSILIPKKSISKDGIFISKLKKIKGFENINTDLIDCDSRLIYDNKYKKFYLKCPQYFDKINVLNRSPIVAIDPGEKIFVSYYSLQNCGHIGDNMREKFLYYQSKIKKLQRDLKKNINKNKNKIKNKKKVKNKINKYFTKIKNIVSELHNKTALYLVTHYDKILLPKFETQNMIKCFGKKFIKNKVKEIKETMNIEEQKKEFRRYTKIKKLSRQSKFLLNNLSHYRFKQHLLNKAKEYGCTVNIITEEFTSKCCSNCGFLSDTYKNRLKICPFCNLKIDRDLNGSRNILIKNWKNNYDIIKKTCLQCK